MSFVSCLVVKGFNSFKPVCCRCFSGFGIILSPCCQSNFVNSSFVTGSNCSKKIFGDFSAANSELRTKTVDSSENENAKVKPNEYFTIAARFPLQNFENLRENVLLSVALAAIVEEEAYTELIKKGSILEHNIFNLGKIKYSATDIAKNLLSLKYSATNIFNEREPGKALITRMSFTWLHNF